MGMVTAHSMSVNVLLLMDKMMMAVEFPRMRIWGIASFVTCFLSIIPLMRKQDTLPQGLDYMWVALRGTLSVTVTLMAMFATVMGTPLGDIGALVSVNSVFAALLGRVFLGEPIHARQMLAALFSMAGAVLISKPGFIFGEANSNLVGCLLALGSGLGTSCMFVVCRKGAKVSASLFTFSTCLQCGLVLLFLPDTPFVSDFPWERSTGAPLESIGWLGAAVCIWWFASMTGQIGFTLCPAALSAAVDTAMRMVSGYAVDALIFNVRPDSLTLIGASLMLGSVVIMTAAFNPDLSRVSRIVPQQSPSGQQKIHLPSLARVDAVDPVLEFPVVPSGDSKSTHSEDNALESDFEVESLSSFLSFAASEFTGCSSALRQRSSSRCQHSVEQQPHLPGAVTAVVLGV
jgi:S-adenosylmethionine uptake transporter